MNATLPLPATLLESRLVAWQASQRHALRQARRAACRHPQASGLRLLQSCLLLGLIVMPYLFLPG